MYAKPTSFAYAYPLPHWLAHSSKYLCKYENFIQEGNTSFNICKSRYCSLLTLMLSYLYVSLISYYSLEVIKRFPAQFGINLPECIFQKSQVPRAASVSAI